MSQTTKQTPKPSLMSPPTETAWTTPDRTAPVTPAPTPQSRSMRLTSLLVLAFLLVVAGAVAIGVHAFTSHRASPAASVSQTSPGLVAHGSGTNIRTENGNAVAGPASQTNGSSTDLYAHGSGNNIQFGSGHEARAVSGSTSQTNGSSTDLYAHGSGNNIQFGSGHEARSAG